MMYFYFMVIFSLTSGFVIDKENAELKEEFNDHDVVKSPSLVKNSEDSIQLSATAFGQDYNIELTKAKNVFHDDFQLLSMELGKDDEIQLTEIKESFPDEVNIFKDKVHGSVLHVSDDNGKLNAEGLLTPELNIVPHSNEEHKVVKSKAIYKNEKLLKSFSKFAKSFSVNKERRELPEVVKPEVLVVVDYKHAQTLQFSSDRINKYLAVFWNAVNLRYALFKDPKIELTIVGAVIIKDPNLQPYMEKNRFVWRRRTYIDYMEALANLAQDVYSNSDKYPKHDLLMVMTGENLAMKDDDGSVDDTFTGVAIAGGACSIEHENNLTLSVGIAEDRPPFYEGVLYHAHEIAHLLGAVHDGDEPAEHLPGSPGAEACPFKDGFLMSYKLGSKNRVHWSQCTVDQIRWFLGTPEASCLLTRDNTKWPMQLNKILPGTLVNVENQCGYTGRNAKAWPQNQNDICVTLYCVSDTSSVTTNGPALDGTPCGYIGNKWCYDGECARIDP